MLLSIYYVQAYQEVSQQVKRDQGRQWSNQGWTGFLVPNHPLTSFEVQEYYQNKPKYTSVYSQNKLRVL